MGLFHMAFTFDSDPPDAARVAARASEVAGLPVRIDSEPGQHATVRFEGFGDVGLRLRTVPVNGTRSSVLTGGHGPDPTLLAAVALALESLGGRPDSLLPGPWRTLVPVSLGMLRWRVLRARLAGLVMLPVWLALAPVMLALLLASVVGELRRFERLLRERHAR